MLAAEKSGYDGRIIGAAWAKRRDHLAVNVASGDSLDLAAEFHTHAAPNDETAIYLSAAAKECEE